VRKGRILLANSDAESAGPHRLLRSRRDRGFESWFLRQRVRCELDFGKVLRGRSAFPDSRERQDPIIKLAWLAQNDRSS